MASYLIVRFSAIGDCVMASYVATAIRQAKPDSTIVWAVETRCMPVLDKARMLDQIVDFPRDRWRRNRWSPNVWREQLSLFARLRRMKFEFGMDLQGHSKTAVCLRIARPAKRIAAFATDAMARRLNPLAPGDPEGRHRVERMLETAHTFGPLAMPRLPMMPTPIPVADLGISDEAPLASISTGAGAENKQYPARQWAEVAQGLMSMGYCVAFLGAQVDPQIEIAGALDFVGRLPLERTMGVVAHSSIHLAADTGTGHMAAAYGVPFISVFGPTDPNLFRPYSDLGAVLRASDRPGDVSPDQILAAVKELRG